MKNVKLRLRRGNFILLMGVSGPSRRHRRPHSQSIQLRNSHFADFHFTPHLFRSHIGHSIPLFLVSGTNPVENGSTLPTQGRNFWGLGFQKLEVTMNGAAMASAAPSFYAQFHGARTAVSGHSMRFFFFFSPCPSLQIWVSGEIRELQVFGMNSEFERVCLFFFSFIWDLFGGE